MLTPNGTATMKPLFCTTALAIGLLATTAHAANIWIDAKFPELIDVQGTIEAGDQVTLAGLLSGHNVQAIRMNSDGGQVMAGVAMAEMIYENKLRTIVGNGDECSSICVLMFTAGTYRGHFSTASIGVHSASYSRDGNSVETDNSLATSAKLSRLFKAYGMPDSIIGKMVTTPGDDITWIKTDELEQSGFSHLLDGNDSITTGSVTPDKPQVQPAQPTAQPKWTMTCQNSKGEYYPIYVYDYMIQVHNTVYQIGEWHWSKKDPRALVITGTTENGNKYAAVVNGPNSGFTYNVGKSNACVAQK
jgi:hypothetical protein